MTARAPRHGRLFVGAGLGLALFLAATNWGRDVRTAAPVAIDFAAVAAKVGLAIETVVVSGNTLTTEDDIIAALGIGPQTSMFALDMETAAARLDVLPLIETVKLSRKWPGRLQVAVTERKAVAVWYDGERYHLMDKAGRGLGVVQPATRLDLPRFAGADAPDAWPDLQRVLDRHPDVRENIRLAERVEQSRWDLHLENGVTLQLPVGEADAALKLYRQLVAQGIDPAIVEIDLRHPARIAVVSRPQQRAAAASDIAAEATLPDPPNGS